MITIVGVIIIVVLFPFCYYLYISKKEKYNFFMQFSTLAISVVALIISLNVQYGVKKDKIIPKLQLKPVAIKESVPYTFLELAVLNYSEYAAKKIFIDVKFGDHPWKKELVMAESKDGERLIKLNKDEKEIAEEFYNHPWMNKLKPGESIRVFLGDDNKDSYQNLKGLHFVDSDGISKPILPSDLPGYRTSGGWKDDLYNMKNGEQIDILIRSVWENEIGRKFDEIFKYKLTCTKKGTGYSYAFIPSSSNKDMED